MQKLDKDLELKNINIDDEWNSLSPKEQNKPLARLTYFTNKFENFLKQMRKTHKDDLVNNVTKDERKTLGNILYRFHAELLAERSKHVDLGKSLKKIFAEHKNFEYDFSHAHLGRDSDLSDLWKQLLVDSKPEEAAEFFKTVRDEIKVVTDQLKANDQPKCMVM
jgi:hypothetical protein